MIVPTLVSSSRTGVCFVFARRFAACSVRQRHSRSNGNLLMISIRLANAIRNLYIIYPMRRRDRSSRPLIQPT
jgi:hypothetical protein